MTPHPPERAYERILVLVDRPPEPGRWGPERRVLQLLLDLRSRLGHAEVVLAATEMPAPEGVRTWAEPRGVRLVAPRDWEAWCSEERFGFSVVVLAGSASAARLGEAIRATQPQARFVALASTVVAAGPRQDRILVHPEERAGALLLERFLDERNAAVLATVDQLLVSDGEEAERVRLLGVAGRVVEYPSVARRPMAPPPGHAHRRGVLSWGRFGETPGDPDEEALVDVTTKVVPMVAALAPEVPVEARLEQAPAGMATHAASWHELRDALHRAAVLVVARPFGRSDAVDALVLEAAEAGTPVVALAGTASKAVPVRVAADLPDLVRQAVTLASDATAWADARAEIDGWIAGHVGPTPGWSDGLGRLLVDTGLLPRLAIGDVDWPPPEAHVPEGPRTVQGQVQSNGFADRRPIDPAYARADIGQDQLLTHVGYERWFEAHPHTDDVAARARAASASLVWQPLVSVVVPVYNTDPDVLEAMVRSVLDQTYPLWELCLADDASTDGATVERLAKLVALDPRIRSTRLGENQGIVGASNAAIELSSGELVALLDHDDALSPDALFEVVVLCNDEPEIDYLYSDEDKLDPEGRRTTPFFKPSWSPHLHLGVNYTTHLSVYRRSLLDRIGAFRPGFDGSQDYDLALRATEVARRVGHLAKPVYSWRMVEGSAAVVHDAKPYALEAARRALTEALVRRGTPGTVEHGRVPGTWRPRYRIDGDPLVSILIPTRNARALLERCIDTILEKTIYRNFEIVVIDNGSDDPDTLDYLRSLKAEVVRYPYRFNYARQMNLAVAAARGDHVLFLNNDAELVTPGWLGAMVELAQQPRVGAVGARLLFPSGNPQHEGVFVGYGGGSAGNVDFGGYFGLGGMIRDATAVTAACMLMRLEPFHAVGGFDERLRVAFNDVDLCLRLRQRGYQVVYTPYAEFFHAESASRGKLHPEEDEAFFVRRWGPAGTFRDPFYNPNLDPVRPFRLRR